MAANIKDVAKMANVSISTVSRVINNAPNVNKKICENVLKAIEQLNYQPNRIAQSLSGTPFKSIGIAVSRSSNAEYTSQILASIGEYAESENYNVILNYAKNDREELEQCESILKGSIAQGIILLGSKIDDLLISKLHEMKSTFVVIGRVSSTHLSSSINQVDTNNIDDSMNIIDYLFSLNHKRIACLHADLNFVSTSDRIEGYIKSHIRANNPIDHSLIVNSGFSINDAYLAALKLLSIENPPTAIFATDDLKAVGCYKAAEKLGLKIPDDLSVAGYNNFEISDALSPSLTTTQVPIKDLGTHATKLLIDSFSADIPPCITILPTKLIIRNSCKEI